MKTIYCNPIHYINKHIIQSKIDHKDYIYSI